jgi:hypothetical protein
MAFSGIVLSNDPRFGNKNSLANSDASFQATVRDEDNTKCEKG